MSFKPDDADSLRALLLDAQRRIRRSEAELQGTTRAIESALVEALEGSPASVRAALNADAGRFASYAEYRLMLRRLRADVRSLVPPESIAIVVSKGDEELLSFHGGTGWHFPQLEGGVYAGHYPASSAAAIDHLEALRLAGGEFLVIPGTALWWLERYAEFGQHLDKNYERLLDEPHCVIFHLRPKEKEAATPLEELQKNWHEYGRRDPLWAIKSVQKKINRRWKEEEFFRTGEEEIAEVMNQAGRIKGVSFGRGRALDFGCGVGRLTQALCRYFDECCGVDIAPSMITLAERYNRHGARCRYYLNPTDDLRLFEDESFDFIYSSLVLQHIRREYSERYVREFVRVLARGGLAVFQMPSEPKPSKAQKGRTLSKQTRPLPARAFSARITPRKRSARVRVAMKIPIQVKVKNLSDVTWPALGASSGEYRIWLGSRWLDEGGILLSNDDGRASLPKDLKPSEQVELTVFVNTPAEPGTYILELDLVQEGVAWFRHQGSEAARINFQVKADPQLAEADSAPLFSNFSVPQMEVHGVPLETAREWIETSGGTIVDLRRDRHAGQDWLGFRYFVTKS